MDEIIKSYLSIPFDELNYCPDVGIMYQRDMVVSASYDKHYFERYVRMERSEIAQKLNAARTAITEKYCNTILDIGVGSGEFIKESRIPACGFDINPVAVKWLRENNIYRDPYLEMPKVDGISLWDTLEHIPNPGNLLDKVREQMYVFVAIPTFPNLLYLKKSKHYRPGEHLYYFTAHGLMTYMADKGFETIELSDAEMRAGREDILTFVFRKLALEN